MFALFLEFGTRTRPQDLWPFLISENISCITQKRIRRGVLKLLKKGYREGPIAFSRATGETDKKYQKFYPYGR